MKGQSRRARLATQPHDMGVRGLRPPHPHPRRWSCKSGGPAAAVGRTLVKDDEAVKVGAAPLYQLLEARGAAVRG